MSDDQQKEDQPLVVRLAIPFLKLLKRKNASRFEKAVASVMEEPFWEDELQPATH